MRIEPAVRFEGLTVASVPDSDELWSQVKRGLIHPQQRWLPAAWLYDEVGSELFDRICATPEYYPTRTEFALLSEVAGEIGALTGAQQLVEIGSGLARKTHHLLQALGASNSPVHYVPFDVSDTTLVSASNRLLTQFPSLTVHAIQGDFTRDLKAVQATQKQRLVAFLGGTIGNFDPEEAIGFVTAVSRLLKPGDSLLIAADLVKDTDRLNAAYNDREGVTAAFNLNTLSRLVRELGAQMRLEDFRHDAFFNESHRRIEMHARAVRTTHVRVPAFDLEFTMPEGDSISTEISRKFTRPELENLLKDAGLEPVRIWEADPPYALCLARRA